MFGGKKSGEDDFDKQYEAYLKKREKEVDIKQPLGPLVEEQNPKGFTKDQNVGALSPFEADFEGGVAKTVQGIKK